MRRRARVGFARRGTGRAGGSGATSPIAAYLARSGARPATRRLVQAPVPNGLVPVCAGPGTGARRQHSAPRRRPQCRHGDAERRPFRAVRCPRGCRRPARPGVDPPPAGRGLAGRARRGGVHPRLRLPGLRAGGRSPAGRPAPHRQTSSTRSSSAPRWWARSSQESLAAGGDVIPLVMTLCMMAAASHGRIERYAAGPSGRPGARVMCGCQ